MIHALTTVISTANVGISTAWITLHYNDAASEYKTEYFTVISTKKKKVCPTGLDNVLGAFPLHNNISEQKITNRSKINVAQY
jgi:hypothetical protein